MVTNPRDTGVVIGIDVGSPTRGFHAVALKDGEYHGKHHTGDARTLVSWCKDSCAQVIGIDAPCGWSATGRARHAERQLMAAGIWCFSTPSLEIAKNHRSNYFGWMLHGALLYTELISRGYPLLDGSRSSARPVCFETFPHAITCALQGKVISAKRKRQDRRTSLQESAVDAAQLTNLDWIDAALCAVTADHFRSGSVKTYGDVGEGFIVVPA